MGNDSIRVFIQNEAGKNFKNYYDEKNLRYIKTTEVSRNYPFPYGFLLDTTSGDGDNVDCFIITNKDLKRGRIVNCTAIGIMEQQDNDQEDHNILAVLQEEQDNITIDDTVEAQLRDFVSHVFDHLQGKRVQVGNFLGNTEAMRYINRCIDYQK